MSSFDAKVHNVEMKDVDLPGNLLVTGGKDRIVHLWDLNTGDWVREMAGHERHITSVAFFKDRNPHRGEPRCPCVLSNSQERQCLNRTLGCASYTIPYYSHPHQNFLCFTADRIASGSYDTTGWLIIPQGTVRF